MSDEEVVLTKRQDRVFLITLNRPDARNAINTELSEALADALEELDSDSDLSVGVLTGAGRGVCAGRGLRPFSGGERPPGAQPRPARSPLRTGCDKPVVVAVEGFALAAGLELAL